MEKYETLKVFVPGGMPEHTYIERTEGTIRKQLEVAKDNLCKLVILTGQTKSGKTVLTQKVFPRFKDNNVWIDGGSVTEENDLWIQIIEALGGQTSFEELNTTSSSQKRGGKVSGGANIVVAKSDFQFSLELQKGESQSNKSSISIPPKPAAMKILFNTKASVIIDDFHYLEKDLQAKFVRAIKPLIFQGVPVILIAIPHRRFDVIKIEREMTGRIENIKIPYWEMDELKQIPNIGFPLLNIEVDESIIDNFSKESLGSPHLMQEFCRMLCKKHDVQKTLLESEKLTINDVNDEIFKEVAESTGKVVFDKLATGPRQRSDRILRKLKDGQKVDIYSKNTIK